MSCTFLKRTVFKLDLKTKFNIRTSSNFKGELVPYSRGSKPCYPLTYWKLENFQTTVRLDGKNWENVETVLKDLQTRCGITPWLDTLFAGNYGMNTSPTPYFTDWRSAVSLCHKNRAKITLYVCEALPSVIFVAVQKPFCIVWTLNLA